MSIQSCAPYDVLEYPYDALVRLDWLELELADMQPPASARSLYARVYALAHALRERVRGMLVHGQTYTTSQMLVAQTLAERLCMLLPQLVDAGVRLSLSFERSAPLPRLESLAYAEELEYWRAVAERRAACMLSCNEERTRNALFAERVRERAERERME
jgi:hypothetical protein